MLFNSIDFLIFFPIVVLIFFVIPKRIKYIWLLVASYYFYMCWNPKYAVLITFSTIISYLSSICVEQCNAKEQHIIKRVIVIGNIICNLGILFFFKYANFFLENISVIVSKMGFEIIERKIDLLLPVGISFYTFQALSYTIDVYRGEIKAEKNLLKFALYISFFCQLVAGPIERSKNLLEQIRNIEKIKYKNFERIRDGFIIMLWGFFQKLVVADRASLLVKQVISNYQNYGFLEILLAAILFAFQIYCDFGGYTNIARGAAQIMGFKLMNNFRQPYLATSIKDFWSRWHISLTSWFTDYLYIPLGGNRKGTIRKYINIFIVFAVSGLWHGASWNFVVWGLLHAVFQIVGDVKKLYHEKYNKNKESHKSLSVRIRRIISTFVLVDFAWIFFVCDGIYHALAVIRQMFTKFQTTSIYEIGLTEGNWFCLIAGIAVLTVVDLVREKGISVLDLIKKQEFWFRWILYIGLIWTIIMFGIYGQVYDSSAFIYFQF